MVDVLHFMFEDEILSMSTAEQSDSRDAMRKIIYENLYKTSYSYGSSKKADFSELDLPLDDEIPTPLNPASRSAFVKPFTPPTKFDPDSSKPFGSVLDAPLG
jgi:hypothetical protein